MPDTSPAYTHILFDFFGTLVAYSSSRVAERHDRSYQLITAHGATLTYAHFLTQWEGLFEQFERRSEASLVEFALTDLCTAFLTAVLPAPPSPALIAQFRDNYLAEWEEGIQRIPGVVEMTAALASHYTLVLVSNTHHRPLVQRQLERAGLSPHLAAVVTSDDYGWRKPAAAIFDRALQISGGRPETAVFVGDSYGADYQGAQAAGLPCFLIDPTGRQPIPAEWRLTSILELTSALQRQPQT
jgi:putative hydrolase of the HAD superfamily